MTRVVRVHGYIPTPPHTFMWWGQMEVENAMGDGRGTLTQEEPNSTIKWNVQTKMERKIKGRLERRRPSANKHVSQMDFQST